MKKRRSYLLVFVLLAAVFAVFMLTQKNSESETENRDSAITSETEATAVPEGTAQEAAQPTREDPQETEQPAEEKTQEQPFLVQITEDDPAIAYVLVRMPDPIGLLPLPTEGEYTRTIRQTMADGTEAINVLHLTTNGFWMEDSNCEGHDCINEGEVTLENREERVLWNMVICLPHQLALELITRNEAEQMIRQ